MNTLKLLACLSVLLLAQPGHAALPEGWRASGSHPTEYDMFLDKGGSAPGGKAASVVRANVKAPQGFGTLMQSIDAGAYRGKRLRLSALVASDGVAEWAGLWMRVDPKDRGAPLAFDNMQGRPIKGKTGWTRREVVLDVAPEAAGIAYGLLLAGAGTVRMADVKLEVVDRKVPTTGGLPDVPKNLDFE